MLYALAASFIATALALPSATPPSQPHLAQAWTAMSTGDGLPGQIGLESYIYQEGSEKDGSMRAHKWDYGADNCIKYEVDGGFGYPGTGVFYVKCDSVDCCTEGDANLPDVKGWDIPKASWLKSTQVGFAGFKDTTGLNNETVPHAEEWWSKTGIPFTKVGIDYNYFITREKTANSTDIITHRIDYTAGATVAPGSILYGNFTVQHDLENFKKTFMPPPECLKPNTLACEEKQVKKWNRKYFKHAAAQRGWF
jgi:hypothetical protein